MSMTGTLRGLLVAVVALATVVAGFRDLLADAVAVGIAIHDQSGQREGTREDDSGTVEGVEEDDVEGQENDDVHLDGSMSRPVFAVYGVSQAIPSTAWRSFIQTATVPLGRGPPAAG